MCQSLEAHHILRAARAGCWRVGGVFFLTGGAPLYWRSADPGEVVDVFPRVPGEDSTHASSRAAS